MRHGFQSTLAVALAACVLSSCGVVGRRPHAIPATEKAETDAVLLLGLEDRVNSADLHPDAATRAFLEATIADDFVGTGASGRRLGKRETLSRWTPPSVDQRPIASSLRDVRLVLAGDAGYLTALSIETERRAGDDTTFALRITDVWRKRGVWQLVAAHVSRVPLPTDTVVSQPVVTHVTTDRASIGDSAAIVAEYQSHAALSRAQSVARYDSSMTDDFMSARSNGTLSGKQATIARWTPLPSSDGRSAGWSQVSNLSVHAYGGVAVVLLTDTQFDSSGRRTSAVHTTDIRRKENGRWRLAALQTSPAGAALLSSEDSAAVVALEHEVVRASAMRDTSSLGRVVDNSFITTQASGRHSGKRTAMARWTSSDSSGLHSELSDIAVSVSSDGAVVEMIDAQVDRNGHRVRASRAIDLFARTGSEWRLVASLAWPESAIQSNTESAEEVRAARAKWNASFSNDPATLGTLLSDSVVQSSIGFRRTGRSQYMELRGRVLGRRPDLSLRYVPGRVIASRDVALESGEWREGWREGDEPTSLSGTYYALWRQTADGWTITAELFLALRCSGTSYCRD